jgi:RNA polymerase sigma factor (sigma-70 family)
MSSSRPGPAESTRSGKKPTSGRAELDYLRDGRSNSLDRFSKEYAGRILGWAIRLGPPNLDPQIIAKDVFSQVLSQLDQQPEKLPAKVWIYRLSRDAIIRRSSKSNRSRLGWLPWKKEKAPSPAASDQEANPRRQAIQEVLQTLSLKEREVLVLMDMEDFSPAEAALLIGSRPQEVAQLLQKARNKFAQEAARKGLETPNRRPTGRRTRR